MFDIAFSELMVIGIVALIVIGPDKLPKVARTAGHLMGKAQRYVSDIKSDIDNQLRVEDLKKLEEEIRQNTQHFGSTQYQVGQIINHDIEQSSERNLPPKTPSQTMALIKPASAEQATN